MSEYISFDSHEHHTLMEREGIQTQVTRQCRVEHAPGAIRTALRGAGFAEFWRHLMILAVMAAVLFFLCALRFKKKLV
jgi:hypothetical protein